MKYSILAVAVFLAFYMAGSNAVDPSILVKLHFKITWREMCLIDQYLKQNLARQIIVSDNNDGAILDTDKIVLYKFYDKCQPMGNFDEAIVSVFVSEKGGNSDPANVDVAMTKKLYKVLNYLIENKQDRYLGNLFVGKIESIEVTGKDAPEKSTAYTEIERLYIGLGVAVIILIVIVVILTIVSCVKNRNKPKRDPRESEVRAYPKKKMSGNENPAYTADGQYHGQHGAHAMTTRF